MASTDTYTYVSARGNSVHCRGYHANGERFNRKDNFSPTLFVTSSAKGNIADKWHDIYGSPVYAVQPGSINESKEFLEQYKNVEGFSVYGMTNWATQYVGERFAHDITPDFSKIRVFSLDIETAVEGGGFPKPEDAAEEVLLITLHDSLTKRYTVYTSRSVERNEKFIQTLVDNGVDPKQVVISQHLNEYHLLKNFVIDWATNYPDAFTGWNTETFDIPYLVRRIDKVIGDGFSSKLSPWGIVRERYIKKNNNEILTYTINGVSHLDFLALMRKFTYGERDSWKLGNVAQDELGQTKLELEGSFKDQYQPAMWDQFVVYNIIDVHLVERLDAKMKLIELAFTIAYMAKINPDEVFSPIRTWDSIIYNHLKERKIIVPPQKGHRTTHQIAGGYVKDPLVGKHKWIVSFDAQSLYPHLMMWGNMSPDTVVHDAPKHVNVEGLLARKYDLSDLKQTDTTLAANGHRFRKDKVGFFPGLVTHYYEMRSVVKKEMLVLEQEYASTKNEQLVGQISSMNAKQMAIKIQLNSLYGASASPFFRFFDERIAEGITMSGQLGIQWVSNDVNAFLNKTLKTDNFDYIVANDTDSIYLNLGPLVAKHFDKETDNQTVTWLDKFCKQVLQPVIDKSAAALYDYMNAYDQRILFKREAISSASIFTAKKRYAMLVQNSEGVQYDDPKIKVVGLEMVRSSTPAAIRDTLKDGIKQVLTGTEKSVQKFVAAFRDQHRQLDVNDIAFPRGVNGLRAYAGSPIYAKGCPIHVRASLLYNHYVRKMGLENKYPIIEEGNKMKFVYLKMPNPFKENIIGFVDVLPPEFKLHSYIDYDTMLDKSFTEAMKTLVTPIGWAVEERSSLADFFG